MVEKATVACEQLCAGNLTGLVLVLSGFLRISVCRERKAFAGNGGIRERYLQAPYVRVFLVALLGPGDTVRAGAIRYNTKKQRAGQKSWMSGTGKSYGEQNRNLLQRIRFQKQFRVGG